MRERRRKKDKKRMKALMALWNEAAGVGQEEHANRQGQYDAESE